ncbi:MAG: hypothetical protein M3Q10_07545 [Chloroflexota bacterium]|nr:hypothetical protein [Chloroflexota bacterium]
MTDWWYVIPIVGLAAVGGMYLRARRGSSGRGNDPAGSDRADTNFAQDREDGRLAGMSAEDRAWEDASLRTNRETRPRDALPVAERRGRS